MSVIDDNRATIKEFIRRNNDGGDVMEMLDEDLRWWIPGEWALSGVYTKSDLLAHFGRLFPLLAAAPRFTINNITCEDDRVALDTTSVGSFADGIPFGNTFHFLFRLRNGRIVEVKEFMDTDYMAKVVQERPEIAG